ncbi:2-oxoglutarate dehydrogenase E2 component (dihydrolipoamide succinyltransferase) [Sphingomonas jejuensis]|uniref:Dihydrolipoamide acetyltransferase component of pyruvate dehydrogenase complex n=1 Tax=Sphingomonas jejuensis TaxID=904715 RepID=A0ABX0XNY5_9SPHN|nr:2-oxo acid dehydrogenase subunit E2 [Sphingomonas jejuensis]NJC34442.1 2-oxoglutarate dehydrogenase E2 component (dihydrolipoamide succinyltransferase) [Sphingomonas jejuensis]
MTDILVPAEQEGTQAVVRGWLKQPGDSVALNDPLVELETDKVTMEVPAPAAGVLAEILLQSGAEAAPGALLGRLRDEAGADAAAPVAMEAESGLAATDSDVPAPPTVATDSVERRLSPSVRRAVRQHGIDPATISGSGRSGRVTPADVDRAVAARGPAGAEDGVGSRSVPHDRMRRAIAENMLNSVTVAPHVTAVFEADFSAIIAHRARHKDRFAAAGTPLTFTAYMLAAAARAMAVAPAINGRWHADRTEIFADVNIGVGTALGDKGLVVPVVERVGQLSLEGIAARLADLTGRARDGRMTPADLKGGTFAVSNHGVSGSLFASPIIIQQPQSAILGVGKLEKRVVVREVAGQDAILIRPMAYVSLTIDHRVVDGHQTNAWLTRFVELIEGWPAD